MGGGYIKARQGCLHQRIKGVITKACHAYAKCYCLDVSCLPILFTNASIWDTGTRFQVSILLPSCSLVFCLDSKVPEMLYFDGRPDVWKLSLTGF